MADPTTNKAPSASVVLPYYGFAAIAFIILAVLIVFSANSFVGHYFNPHLLAITHIAALGWGTMIIFGALFQLLPVILETTLYSETLAKITFLLFAAGIILLCYSFWNFTIAIPLQISSVLVLLAFILFFLNISLTAKKAVNWSTEADFIVTSTLWLLVTGLIGVLMVFNFRYVFLSKSHLVFLKIHAHLGMAGWFLMLIIGVASKLLPMFLLASDLNKKKLSFAYYLINAALIVFTIDVYLTEGSKLLPIYAVAACTGVLFFISYVREAYKKRIRKNLDHGMKQSMIAFALINLPLLLCIILSMGLKDLDQFSQQLFMLYGTSFFMGFITSLILGQTYKTLPFIVWLEIHNQSYIKENKLLPKDLYSEKIAQLQTWLYIPAVLFLFIGIFIGKEVMIRGAGILLAATATLYNINVFKMLYHCAIPKKLKQMDHGYVK